MPLESYRIGAMAAEEKQESVHSSDSGRSAEASGSQGRFEN